MRPRSRDRRGRRLVLSGALFGSVACGAPPEDEPGPEPASRPTIDEGEPNDTEATDLGVLALPAEIVGAAETCGTGGGWGEADTDRLRLRWSESSAVWLRVHTNADLDWTILGPDGVPIAERSEEGLSEEPVVFSLDPTSSVEWVGRCWAGDDAEWRLRVEVLP